jgi:hypothetical protein
VQPGDLGLFKGPNDSAYQQLLAQKQAAREAAIQKLRIQTNRPQGLTPPGQTSVTPGQGANAGSSGTASEVAAVLAFAKSKGETWSPARVNAFIAYAKANNLPLPGAQ